MPLALRIVLAGGLIDPGLGLATTHPRSGHRQSPRARSIKPVRADRLSRVQSIVSFPLTRGARRGMAARDSSLLHAVGRLGSTASFTALAASPSLLGGVDCVRYAGQVLGDVSGAGFHVVERVHDAVDHAVGGVGRLALNFAERVRRGGLLSRAAPVAARRQFRLRRYAPAAAAWRLRPRTPLGSGLGLVERVGLDHLSRRSATSESTRSVVPVR